jgi:hypothetical protein
MNKKRVKQKDTDRGIERQRDREAEKQTVREI